MHIYTIRTKITLSPVRQHKLSQKLRGEHPFYREIDAHRIPVERDIVAALAHAPGVLDFYIWLVWKNWTNHGAVARIPLTGPGSLKDQLGVANYALERTFRLTLRRWLRTVRALWPECPAQLAEDHSSLLLASSRGAGAICSAP
jgi:hypothetical protein